MKNTFMAGNSNYSIAGRLFKKLDKMNPTGRQDKQDYMNIMLIYYDPVNRGIKDYGIWRNN